MPRFARLFLVAAVVIAGIAPAHAARRPVPQKVAPGYDLFVTPDGGGGITIETGIANVPVMTFRGHPIGTFDFGRHGVRRVGRTDTIVRRLDAATPASPVVRIELVGLLLESTNVPGYFVTLQSARPAGLPSTGTLEFAFDRSGRGGALTSELQVNYDVRHGSPAGPIVATGTTGMGFVARDVMWTHQRLSGTDSPPPFCEIGAPGFYCLSMDGTKICHKSGIPNHWHCVSVGDQGIPMIDGVNHRLNGRDTAADFHAVGTGKRTSR